MSLTSLFLWIALAAIWSTVAAWHMGWALLILPIGSLFVLASQLIRKRKWFSMLHWAGMLVSLVAIYPMSVIPVADLYRKIYGPRWYSHYRKYVAPIDYAKKNFPGVNELRIWYVKTWLEADKKRSKSEQVQQ